MIAAARGHDIVVRQLLAFGADSTLTNKHGNTALILAMYAGHVNVVKILLAKGDPKQLLITNKLGQTTFDFARELKNPAISRLFAKAK
jgi:ankyrin repeat protein